MSFSWAGNTIDQVNVFPTSHKFPRRPNKINDPSRPQEVTVDEGLKLPPPMVHGWDS